MLRIRAASLIFPLLAALLIAPLSSVPARADDQKHKGVENKERKAILNGKTIRSIKITVRDIFDEGEKGVVYDTANEVKINTRERVVQRELLFKEGEAYDQFRVEESVRNIRGLGYLTNIEVLPKIDGDVVDVEVKVQDTWTFIPQFGYSSGTGKSNLSAGMVESNLLGYGKRAEILYSEDENRKGFQSVYADNHIWDTEARFVGGVFIRNDGNREVFEVGRPFRTLAQDSSWIVSGDVLDTVGRLFKDGSEDYIYRQQKSDVDVRYTIATGNAEVRVRRFALGYNYNEAQFSQATLQDYEDLSLDPADVSNDPSRLAENRRFSGPLVAYQMIEPDFISLDYIDRFERVQDYNLGDTFSFSTQVAPHFLGSDGNFLLLNTNRSIGQRFSSRSFLRAEVGINSRYGEGNFENTLARGEIKFFQSFQPSYYNDLFLGRHTLAANLFLDYGNRLDKDREFLVGGDNVIRGYEANTFAGDKRVGLNIEDRIHLVDDLYELVSLGGAVFADVGGATREPFSELLGNGIYSDVGVGLRFAFPRSSGGRILRVDLAFPLRDGPDGSNAWQLRVVFQGGQLFSSQLRSEAQGSERANIEVGTDK